MAVYNSDERGDDKPGDTGTAHSREKSLGVVERALAVATALLALISAILGLWVKKSADTRTDLGNDVSTLQDQNSSLQKQVEELNQQNSALEDRLSVLSKSSPTGANPTTGASQGAVRSAEISAEIGTNLDLLSGIVAVSGSGSIPQPHIGFDSWTQGQSAKIYRSELTVWFAAVPIKPSRDDCIAKLSVRKDDQLIVSVNPRGSSLGVGDWACIEYGADHVASLGVKKFSRDARTATFSYTVWPR